ncbi:hypothetical protein IGM_06475 [Bacillus cereus HuB4-4]|uniref:Uncharacterized protein n=1 Tax=Bacillus cereus HuB4-4 TaxID=1053211 RepID=A0A9W5QMZ5_BACCE|nr:hypothetical protein [Bacillus cereus]EOP78868.1 hypothetical protein IGM_06475 [Bacillus cereus HuB4-4]
MNAAERERRIGKLEEEINGIWLSLFIGCIMYLASWLGIEPMIRTVLDGENFPTSLINIIFNYIIGAAFWIGYIIGIITILKKKKEIRRYKKEKTSPSKINIQKDDINQNPVYVIDHSKDKPNQYEKGDRDMMKRVFNQNNNVSTNLGKQNTNKTRSKGSPIRSYNGSTRSSNNIESNNIVLDVVLGSSIYSSDNGNNCSQSDSSSMGDSGPSCD